MTGNIRLFAYAVLLMVTPAFAAKPVTPPSTTPLQKQKPLQLVRFEFKVATNLPGFKFKGQASTVDGTVELGPKGEPLKVKASFAPTTFVTGLDDRDKHLRERILTDKEKKLHPVNLSVTSIQCQGETCAGQGTLSIAGNERPLKLNFIMKEQTAKGTFDLKLSEFGIESPSQLGVRVKDDIPIEFEVKV